MPLYLVAATLDQSLDPPLAARLAALETSIRRSGGQLLQTLSLGGGELSMTVEAADELSWFRVVAEAADLGLQLRGRVVLTRDEAEALDAAHRLRRASDA